MDLQMPRTQLQQGGPMSLKRQLRTSRKMDSGARGMLDGQQGRPLIGQILSFGVDKGGGMEVQLFG